MSFCIELFCVVTLQYQILVRIAIAYFIIEKKKAAPQPWQAIAQRFCSIGISKYIHIKFIKKKASYNTCTIVKNHVDDADKYDG